VQVHFSKSKMLTTKPKQLNILNLQQVDGVSMSFPDKDWIIQGLPAKRFPAFPQDLWHQGLPPTIAAPKVR